MRRSTPLFVEHDLYPSFLSTQYKCQTSPMWYSPFYSPSSKYFSSLPSSHAMERAINFLAGVVQNWLATFPVSDKVQYIDESAILLRRRRIRLKLEGLLRLDISPNDETSHMYGCCRLATQVLLRAESKRCQLHESVQGTEILACLQQALDRTDLLNLWNYRRGLLFWVIIIYHVSALGTTFQRRKISTTILAQLSLTIANSEYHAGVGLRPLERLMRFQDICKTPLGSTGDF